MKMAVPIMARLLKTKRMDTAFIPFRMASDIRETGKQARNMEKECSSIISNLKN